MLIRAVSLVDVIDKITNIDAMLLVYPRVIMLYNPKTPTQCPLNQVPVLYTALAKVYAFLIERIKHL